MDTPPGHRFLQINPSLQVKSFIQHITGHNLASQIKTAEYSLLRLTYLKYIGPNRDGLLAISIITLL